MADSNKIEDAANILSLSDECDVMIINGDIYSPLQDMLIKEIKNRHNKKKNLSFIMATPGGSPDCAYRMSRAIQDNYENVTAIVAGWCKSAGTLCVIGAKEVVMFDDAELGPLDVQIARRDEIGERDSGLVLGEALLNLEQHAFSLFENFLLQIKNRSDGTITFKTATEISTEITNGLFEPIYRQIDPQKIGEAARSLAVAEAYGSRLNIWAKNLKPTALRSLTLGYPTHGFVIDRREAGELFKKVREPKSTEKSLIDAIGFLAQHPINDPLVRYLNAKESKNEIINSNTAAKNGKAAAPANPKRTNQGSRKPTRNSRT